MTQLLSGLAAAHAVGIVHRDVKESNVLLDRATMRAKLCDFGIARSEVPLPDQADPTSTAVVIGTPHYIAPERYLGVRRDPRSDLYSAGVVFHRLLTGRLPFDAPGADSVTVARKALTEEVPHIVGVPEALVRVCLRLLSRDLDERYQTAQATLEALHYAHRFGDDAGQTLDRGLEPVQTRAPRSPTLTATVVLALMGALLWVFWV
jgi:serine/threonine-protein kinase